MAGGMWMCVRLSFAFICQESGAARKGCGGVGESLH